jgi:prefoldin subunit 5
MMSEESETPDAGPPSGAGADVLAERRARHADPAVLRRAEAAEAVARNLETHLAALEQRIEEVGRERERVAQKLTERESDVRSVKQREYAEQQLRVEAEERSERLQREMRAEIQELRSRLEETERHVRELSAELAQLRERDARLTPIVRELMDVAAGLRAGFERELTTLREELQQQVVWERETYVRELTAMGARMEDLRFELTRTAADLRAQLSAEPVDAALLQHMTEPASEREAAHRREMADALVAAVERLRARVAEVKEAEEAEAAVGEALVEPPVEESLAEEATAQESPVPEPAAIEEPPVVEGSVVVEEPVSVEEPAVVEESAAVERPSVEEPPSSGGEPEAVEESEATDVPQAVEPEGIEELLTVMEPETSDRAEIVETLEVVDEVVGAQGEAVAEDDSREGGLAAPIAAAERLAPREPSGGGLGPGSTVDAKAVTSEPMALQSRLLSVPEKRTSWLAPAIRRLAVQRDAKLAAELVIELIPAQRDLVEEPLNYEIKIGELGTFYVTLDPGQATISREPRGSVDFSLEGPVAAFGELAAGGASRRHPGLRIRKGRRRARRFLKSRRRPIALADLAVVGVDVWPGLLLLAMAEAIDPDWTDGRRFELAFEIEETAGIVIYVRVCDGESIQVSRTAAGQPAATISLSGHALICLLAGTQPPAEHRTLVSGDVTAVDTFLQWTARAQGLTVADA